MKVYQRTVFALVALILGLAFMSQPGWTQDTEKPPLRVDTILGPEPLDGPQSVAHWGDSLFVVDTRNNLIRVINLKTREESVLAGNGEAKSVDGFGTDASFWTPLGITCWEGCLYVTTFANVIRKIDVATKEVTTVAGVLETGQQDGDPIPGFVDGAADTARFNQPRAIICKDSCLYIADYGNHSIRKLNLTTNQVTTVAGTGVPGYNDGATTTAQFKNPIGLVCCGDKLYVSDGLNHVIRCIDLSNNQVTTPYGTPPVINIPLFGFADGNGNTAKFNVPAGMDIKKTQNDTLIYIADTQNHAIRCIDLSTGDVTTIAGTPGLLGFGHKDGPAMEAKFNYPNSVALWYNEEHCEIFVADTENNRIRRVGPPIPGPNIKVSPLAVFFAAMGDTTICITNSGDDTLKVSKIFFQDPHPGFEVDELNENDDPLCIAPGDSIKINVTFEPEESGTFGGRLQICSNDPDKPESFVSFSSIFLDIKRIKTDIKVVDAWINGDEGPERSDFIYSKNANLFLGLPGFLSNAEPYDDPNGNMEVRNFVRKYLGNLGIFLSQKAFEGERLNDIKLLVELHGIDLTGDGPKIKPMGEQNLWFWISLAILKRSNDDSEEFVRMTRTDFPQGHPMLLFTPVHKPLISNSGFPNPNIFDLALAYYANKAYSRIPIIGFDNVENNPTLSKPKNIMQTLARQPDVPPEIKQMLESQNVANNQPINILKNTEEEPVEPMEPDGFLIGILPHLSDIVGLSRQDVPLPPKPIIVNGPTVEADTTDARITWLTSGPINTAVAFGTSKDAKNDTVRVEGDSSGVLLHKLELENLMKGTTYYYEVVGKDPFGRLCVSECDSFTTRSVGDFSPPLITLGPVVIPLPRQASVHWTTARKSTGAVKVDTLEDMSTAWTIEDDQREKTHWLKIPDLTSNTKYFYMVCATNGDSTVVSDTLMFRTPPTLDDGPPIVLGPCFVDNVTDTTVVIRGRTHPKTPVTMEIRYWKEGTVDTLVAFDSEMTSDHAFTLTDLIPDCKYFYIVCFRRTDNDQVVYSRPYMFRTRRPGQMRPFHINRVAFLHNAGRFAIWHVRLNRPGTVWVYYQADPNNTGEIDIDTAKSRHSTILRRNHTLFLNGLDLDTRYNVKIIAKSPDGKKMDMWPRETDTVGPVVSSRAGGLSVAGIAQIPGANASFTSSPTPDMDPPQILSGPTVVSQSADQLVVQWTTNEVATSVAEYGMNGNLTDTTEDPEQVTDHQLTIPNLTANTAYTIKVSSTDPSNNGPTGSPEIVAWTTSSNDVTPPVIDDPSIMAAPSDVQATILWSTNEGANAEVQYGTSADSLNENEIDANINTDHQVILTGLSANTTYFYRVLNTDASSNGPTQSTTKMFTTTAEPDTTHPVVSNVQASAVAETDGSVSVTVTWDTDILANSFVDYDSVANLNTETIGDNTGRTSHSLTITGLDLNEEVFYRAGSSNINDTRVPAPATTSTVMSIMTPVSADNTPPTVPTAVNAVPGDDAVLVDWTPSTDESGVAGYNISRNGVPLASNVTDIPFLDQSAGNGMMYSYKVTAIDEAGNNSTESDSTSNVTPETTQVPTAPSAQATGDTVSLKPILVVDNATPVSDPNRTVLTYEFQVSTDASFNTIVATQIGITEGNTSNPTNWQVTDSGQIDDIALMDGVTYYWRSRAHDGSFSGTWSTPQMFVASASRPTSVTLATIAAEDLRGIVTVNWAITQADPTHLGFHVYRSLQATTGFERVTNGLLTGVDDFTYVDSDVRVGQQYYYMIEAVGVTGLTERFGPVVVRVGAPETFALLQNRPNPFNPATTIRFDLPEPATVSLIVYNILGQEVIRLLDNEKMTAGFHVQQWSGRNGVGRTTASGVYIYRIVAGDNVKAKKMLLLK